MEVGIVGLGKLGLPMAAVYADKGHKVVGVDANEKLLERINKAEDPYNETNLGPLLRKLRDGSNWPLFASDYGNLIGTELCFVVVPTPSDSYGGFSNEYIVKVLDSLLEIEYDQPVVIVSTIMPGSCRVIKEQYGFNIIYNPEFIALGSVIHNMQNPDAILIGSSGEFDLADAKLAAFHRTIVGSKVPIHMMSYENAELAKLALNCYITMKITFANQIATRCEALRGGDVDAVLGFIGDDSRVGKKYLKGGLGFGGPCFPRDNEAFIASGGFNLQASVVNHNNFIASKIAERIKLMIQDQVEPRVVILGTSYKPYTRVVERSQSLELASLLSKVALVGTAEPGEDLAPILEGADLVVLCLDCKELAELDLSKMRHKRVFDCWRVLKDREQCEMYQAVGLNL